MNKKGHHLTAIPGAPGLTTEQLAALLGIKPQTLRRRYCLTGSYFSVRPRKFWNGRLCWPEDSVRLLLRDSTPQA